MEAVLFVTDFLHCAADVSPSLPTAAQLLFSSMIPFTADFARQPLRGGQGFTVRCGLGFERKQIDDGV
jgi:hypothetical protein